MTDALSLPHTSITKSTAIAAEAACGRATVWSILSLSVLFWKFLGGQLVVAEVRLRGVGSCAGSGGQPPRETRAEAGDPDFHQLEPRGQLASAVG
jgi:hypothetical protein